MATEPKTDTEPNHQPFSDYKNSVKVVLGAHAHDQRESPDATAQWRSVVRVVKHNMGADMSNDIALFQLDRPVTISSHVRPVCLPRPSGHSMADEPKCLSAGWGTVGEGEVSFLIHEI